MKHELSGGSGCVYLLVEYHEPDTLILKRPDYLHEVMDGTGEPIQAGDDKSISFTGEAQSLFQGGAIIASFSREFFLKDFFAPVNL